MTPSAYGTASDESVGANIQKDASTGTAVMQFRLFRCIFQGIPTRLIRCIGGGVQFPHRSDKNRGAEVCGMIQKLTKATTRLLAILFAVFATSGAWADFAKTNPVTGETENYTWKFVGTDTWDGTGYWQNSSGANPSGTPAKTSGNTWDPILFDGDTININASMSVEGWNLRMGLYNGANVTMNTFVKYQGDTTMWMTVDETSQLTIGGFGGGNITANQAIKLSVAKANGITWNVNLTSGNANNTFEYYLKGAGSVSYQAVSAANHKIKMADVTLTGNAKSVQSKTLVTFTSSSKIFTADATIKVLNADGDLVVSKWLGTVNTTGTTTLTPANKVGACELVQTATGILLYYVEGDPTEAGYTPSININFKNNEDNGLTTRDDVGLTGYAAPGTSWNNFLANNATYSTVNAIDSTGAASVASGVSVTVSGTRGSWACGSLTAASNPLHGYIDESAGYMTPTVTITGIPYANYRVIVYHSTDQANAPFGYDTINGTDFTYVNGVQAIGTSTWGNSGASNSAEPIAEGVNTLVSGILSGSTVTMVAHRIGSSTPSARGCFAAIQVVKVDVGEGNLLIPVTGDTTYTVSEDASFTKVIISGTGTLTLEGSSCITADVLEIDNNSAIVMNESRLATTTVIGEGAAIYDGALPPAGKGWTDSAWKGRLWLKNYSLTGLAINSYGNSGSTLVFTGIAGHFPKEKFVINPAIELVDDGETKALTVNNGFSYNSTGGYPYAKISKLKGSGTLVCSDSGDTVLIWVVEANAFTGKFSMTNKAVYLGDAIPAEGATITKGMVVVKDGVTMTCPSSANWGVSTGTMRIDGTLTVDGFVWAVGGIQVNGELKATALSKFGGGTTITTSDNGVFTFITNSNADDMNVDYARLQGTGTLRLEGSAYRCISTNHFPTAMTVDNRLTVGYLHRIPGLEITIGSLAGDGYLRSDWGGSAGDRSLKVLQAKDTTWSGKFWTTNPHRLGSLIVAQGANNTAGTLTLSATHEAVESTGLTVQSGAKVNLTGTWVGATTVAGTFGGTGTLTGNLTFNDGATFKAFATDADGLSVSGTVTCPAEGTVTVDVSDLTLTADVALLTASNLNKDKFTLTGAPENSTLEVVEGVLTLKLPVTITVPAIANATATATIGGETVTLDANGQAAVPAGSVVTVTYTANEGYALSGTAQYTIDTASATTFDITDTATVEYVASITVGNVTNRYTSLQEAISVATSGQSVTLLADVALTSTITIAKNLTLDLNGKNVTATNCRALYVSAGTIEVTGSGTISTVVTAGTSFSTSSSVIRVGGDTVAASFTLGANVTVSTDYCYGITYFGRAAQTVVINGTVSVTGTQPALSGNGNSWNAEVALTVNGTVSAEHAYAIYNPQQGTTVINGTVTGVGGIEVKAGAVTVNEGATITATGKPSYTQSNQDGTSTVGYAIASVGNAGYANNATVAITGGTINGTTITIAENGATAGGVVTATSNSVIVPAGYEWVEKTGGGYTLKAVVGTTFTVY